VRYRDAGFDAAGGGGGDEMTLAIAHDEADSRTVLDLVRAIAPPFSPEHAVETFATVLKSYHIDRVVGDRYAGEWPKEQFQKRGIEYLVCDRPKSDLYRDLLPRLRSNC
jgi:hypothetical protein